MLTKNKINNILVIGNGFDLAHGLPTRYRDIMTCCKSLLVGTDPNMINNEYVKKSVINTLEKVDKTIIDKHPFEMMDCVSCGKYNPKNITLCNNVDKCKTLHTCSDIFSNISNSLTVEYFFEKCEDCLWCDIEHDIENIVMDIENRVCENGERVFLYRDRFKFLSSMKLSDKNLISSNDIKKLRKEIINSFRKELIFLIKQYLAWVMNNHENLIRNKLNIKTLNVDKIINFNYTDTYTRLYDDKVKCCYVHGKLDGDIVLGGNFNSMSYLQLDKSHQRLLLSTSSEYMDWLRQPIENIYFIGHSLDVLDKVILKEILACENVKQITIFYHKEEEKCKLLSNLDILLTHEEVYKRMHNGKECKILFKDLSSLYD